jgi:phosphate-selective porin OprO/OprP
MVWTPTDYTRFLLNYGRMQYSGASVPAAGGDRSYAVDAFGLRAQFDF